MQAGQTVRKTPVDLSGVQKTLLLPLWGRAVETRRAKPLLVDRSAAGIIGRIDYDFSTIASNMSPVTRLAWIARSLHVDRTIKRFLEDHPGGAIVNIGCGLDTTFERVDNGNLLWYELDLPDVIRFRRTFIPESERRRYLESSFLDEAWLREVPADRALLFVAAGVFYYFREDQIRAFFTGLAGRFPGSELVFDAASRFGVRAANRRVIKAGGMDESAVLRWSIQRGSEIEAWSPRLRLLEEYPLFKGMKKGLGLSERWGLFMSDSLKVMFMVHLACVR